jgi:hypothetical protein
VLAFIGRAFYQTGEEIPPQIIERSQRLWEWQLSEAQTAPSIIAYIHELAAFGWWFRADICPPEYRATEIRDGMPRAREEGVMAPGHHRVRNRRKKCWKRQPAPPVL